MREGAKMATLPTADEMWKRTIQPIGEQAIVAEVQSLRLAVERLTETNQRLHRRCQVAEKAVQTKCEDFDKRSAKGLRNFYFQRNKELEADVERLTQERDRAIAHDQQPYPTAEAYEKTCAALHKHRQRANEADAALVVCQQERDKAQTQLARRVVATAEARRFQAERLIVRYVNLDGDAEYQADMENELAAAELRGSEATHQAIHLLVEEVQRELDGSCAVYVDVSKTATTIWLSTLQRWHDGLAALLPAGGPTTR